MHKITAYSICLKLMHVVRTIAGKRSVSGAESCSAHTTAAAMQQQQDEEHHALCLDGVVENVLRFLTQKERFRCSLVSSRWHAAAVAVTAEAGLLLSPCSSKAEHWLVKYGAELQALVVRNCSLCGNGDTNSIAGLQQLTRLELSSVTSRTGLLRAIGDSMQVCG